MHDTGSNLVEVGSTVIILVLFMVAGSFLVSWVSGWRLLARSFKREGKLPAGSIFVMNATMRAFMSYKRTLLLQADPGGMYMRFWPRLGHSLLYIPWSEIEVGPVKKLLFFSSQTLLLGREQRVPLRLSARYVTQLAQRAGLIAPGTPVGAAPGVVPAPPPLMPGTVGDLSAKDERARLGLPPAL